MEKRRVYQSPFSPKNNLGPGATFVARLSTPFQPGPYFLKGEAMQKSIYFCCIQFGLTALVSSCEKFRRVKEECHTCLSGNEEKFVKHTRQSRPRKNSKKKTLREKLSLLEIGDKMELDSIASAQSIRRYVCQINKETGLHFSCKLQDNSYICVTRRS